MDIRVDASELNALAVDLGHAAGRVVDVVDPVLKRGAENVKSDMQDDARGSKHFARVAATITYDRAYGLGVIGYEVGPDRRRGGSAGLAGAYLGWPGGGGGSLSLDGPLNAEEPRLLKALGDALEGLL